MSELLLETVSGVPDLVDISASQPQQFPFLLESSARGPLGRYSLLLQSNGEQLLLHASGQLTGPGEGRTFLQRLNSWYNACAYETVPCEYDELPFLGGWFLYLGYELAAQVEPILQLPVDRSGLPTALAARCDAAVLIDHEKPGQAVLVAESEAAMSRLKPALEASPTSQQAELPTLSTLSSEPGEDFDRAVRKIHQYLRAGDVFQVNLSRGWHGRFSRPPNPDALYRQLCRANPAPFAGMMRWQDMALMSSSPERLVETRGTQVQTRPIAGTHPRGNNQIHDEELREQMLAHPKERAEHIMLIDLERNDLGRVCVPGSVEVDELMVVESYAHVHHIVSNVRGQLRAGVSPVDVIAAVFPGGTITGCPKVRCMQIIAELEGTGRGFYTGAMGYLDRRGRMDLNILIRSMLLEGRQLTFRTGAGIVADSDPQRELQETRHKAQGLLTALGAGPMNDA